MSHQPVRLPSEPDNDGSSWDCVECGTMVVGPSVALPCPKCGGRMVARAGVGVLLIEAQAWVERMETALCDPRAGHGADAKCAKLHSEARHIKGLFEKISRRVGSGVAARIDAPREATFAEFRESIRKIAKEAQQSPHALDALAFAGTLLDAAWRAVSAGGGTEDTK